ncbi:MAG: hypothetical protein KQH53_16790 [Desulfarculaceae bacterium]|nr:hypothetical protein [Desulfarculaceae bacterium]
MQTQNRAPELQKLIEHIRELFLPQPPSEEEIVEVIGQYDPKAVQQAIAAIQANRISQFQVFKSIVKYFAL